MLVVCVSFVGGFGHSSSKSVKIWTVVASSNVFSMSLLAIHCTSVLKAVSRSSLLILTFMLLSRRRLFKWMSAVACASLTY